MPPRAPSPQQYTLKKPWNQASTFHLNYSCKYGYTSGLKMGAAKFLAANPLGWVNCK